MRSPIGTPPYAELRRVLEPGGRHPHMVPFEKLRAETEAAGLRFERWLGESFGYYARFVV